MNTNTNNDSKAFNMNSIGKALDTPVDEHSGDWASSTLSALGPAATTTTTTSTTTTSPATYPSTVTTHPTMSVAPTLGSTSASEAVTGTPAYSHKFPNPNPTNTNPSAISASVPPPIPSKSNPFLEDHTSGDMKEGVTQLTTGTTSVPSTSTFSPDVDLRAPAPTFDKELTTASTSESMSTSSTHPAPTAQLPSAYTPTHTHTQILESASTATTPGLHIPGAYPGMEKERMTDGDLETAKRATATALEKAKVLALATGETMMDVVDTVLPAVKAYIPSAQTAKEATMNAGSVAAETAAPYIPTAEQTKEAAITAGQATANAGIAAGQTVGNTAANAGIAAGQTVGNTAANAASYIPEVHPVDTTRSYLASAGDVIRSYVPASVSAYLPGSAAAQPTTTLPSQETGQNAHPASSGGVGTLPGPPGEIGVAVLPEERTGGKNIDDLLHATPHDSHKPATHLGGVGILPGDAGESGVAILPEERNRSKLPSAEAGLGLPGAKDEAGVAVLPIERGAGDEHALMEKDVHSVLVGAIPGAPEPAFRNEHTAVAPKDTSESRFNTVNSAATSANYADKSEGHGESAPKAALLAAAIPAAEHHDAVNVNKTTSTSSGHGSVAFIDPPFQPTTNVYSNSPPRPSDSLLSPAPVSTAASTFGGASADASIRSLAGSKKENNDQKEFEQTSNPITTTTNSVPHPEPSAVPVPNLHGKDEFKPTPPPKDMRMDAHHQDSTTATLGHGSPLNATNTTSNIPTHANANATVDDHATGAHALSGSRTRSPDGSSHAKSASTSSSSSVGKKPSLLSKMKGEMKVLSGKIGHNEEKIEEGRRMMGKPLN